MIMCYDTLRVYEAGRLYDVDLPDWYHEANRLWQKEGDSWHHSFTRALGCYSVPLTDDSSIEGGWLEVRFWPNSTVGTFVLIETDAGLVEQVLVPNRIDWLPFFSQHIAPLITAAAQSALAVSQRNMSRAFVSWARHGEGSHVDRETGQSRIAEARQARAKVGNGGAI
jgi:hypothetical protein